MTITPVGVGASANDGTGASLRALAQTVNLIIAALGGVGTANPVVEYATAAALAANTYSAGVLTASANGALTVDGTAVAVTDRILVKDEASQLKNGVYVVTATGSGGAPYVLTRADDYATWDTLAGTVVFVQKGTANDETAWQSTADAGGTLGTTAVAYVQVSSGTISATQWGYLAAAVAPFVRLDVANDWLANQGFVLNSNLAIAAATSSQLMRLEARGNGTGPAVITFHRPGAFAAYLGLDTDNVLKYGGYSVGANAYTIWHSGNDGAGSGLDADLLDGLSSAAFAQLAAANTFTLTGNSFTTPSGNNVLTIGAPTSSAATLLFNSSGSARWIVGRGGADGSDNFQFYSYGSGGVSLQVDYASGDTRILAAPSALATNSAGFRGLGTRRFVTATHTLELADSGNGIYVSSGTFTFTVPPNSSVAFPIMNTVIPIYVSNAAGTVTIAEGSGVTINRGDGSSGSGSRTVAPNSFICLTKLDTNQWLITGNFT